MIVGNMRRFPIFILLVAGLGLLVGLWWDNGRSAKHTYHLYYLAPDSQGISQIFSAQFDAQLKEAGSEMVTQSSTDIFFYAVSPEGMLAFTVQENGTGTAIYLADSEGRRPRRLLACPQATCDQLVWHPDGRRLVYERREAAAPGSPRLWWLDIQTGETMTLLAEGETVSSGARFSAEGQWISYVVREIEGVEVYHFDDGRRLNFSSATGRAAVWSPVADSLIISDYDVLVFHDGDEDDHQAHSHDTVQTVHLFLTELTGPTQTQIGADLPSDDASPAWSPDGEWLVMGRKVPRTTMGRQLWLMRSDGSEARALTDAPEIHFGLPSWSADGRYILCQRAPIMDAQAVAGVWLVDVETGEQIEIAAIGRLPQWRDRD